MRVRTSQRVDRDVIDDDQIALQRVANLGDYRPMRDELSIEALRALEAAMLEAINAEDRANYEARAARERAIAAIQAFHESMKAVKAQIVAQYGEDSLALHAIGRKRRSERSRPSRRPRAE